MNYIIIDAVTQAMARERAVKETGYDPAAIGQMVQIAGSCDNSRQKTFVFETSNDVTVHPDYTKTRLFDRLQPIEGVDDGPTLVYGREVTVGG